MEKIVHRRRIFLRADSPAVRVEIEIVNTDAEPRSVLANVFNGASLGRVDTWTSMPGLDGKVGGLDLAEERASTFTFAPEVAGAWQGGVNRQGLGVGFSFDWPNVDAMQVCMYKTVGAVYHTIMRRRTIPAGQSITFRYTFMPFADFGALDGMAGDLAGGFLVGRQANFIDDVAAAEVKPGVTPPLKVFLASGTGRRVAVHLECRRQEDGKTLLDETALLDLTPAKTAVLNGPLTLGDDGLYLVRVTAVGEGVRLQMEKPLEVGHTKLFYRPTPPSDEKRGVRDGGANLGPAHHDPQFRTLDPKFVTEHLPLVKNHAGGPVRALFLVPANGSLGHVREICQRADLTPDYYAITKVTTPKFELHPRELTEFREKLRSAPPEVLVTFGIHWGIGLKRQPMGELFQQVREGLGAVLVVRDLKSHAEVEQALADAREVKQPPGVLAVSAAPIRRFELGRGRIVVILRSWVPNRDEVAQMMHGWNVLTMGKTTATVDEIRWRGFEYSYAALAEAIRWAAGRSTPVTMAGAVLEDNTVHVDVQNDGGPLPARLRVVARSRRWEVHARGEQTVALPQGASRHTVKLDATPDAGPLALEVHRPDARGPRAGLRLGCRRGQGTGRTEDHAAAAVAVGREAGLGARRAFRHISQRPAGDPRAGSLRPAGRRARRTGRRQARNGGGFVGRGAAAVGVS